MLYLQAVFNTSKVVAIAKGSIVLVVIIALFATLLSIISYQYSTSTANAIFKIASDDVRSNADIEVHDLANILLNKMEGISSNLELMSSATAIQNQNIVDAIPLFSTARQSTKDFTSSYFWVDSGGKLLWADAFTNKTIEQNFNGADRSFRDYYLKPKETLKPFYSTVVESVDGIPRLYIAYPILDQNQNKSSNDINNNNGKFKGIVVAAIDLQVLGKFLQSQVYPKYQISTGMLDPNGIILYSSNSTVIGQNVFGPKFQGALPAEIKDTFNNFMKISLKGQPGSGDFTYKGDTSTISYKPVKIRDNDFAILYVVVPHKLAGSVNTLIDDQRTFNTILLIVIGSVAAGIAALAFIWNKRLSETVKIRTAELKESNDSLVLSNQELAKVNQQLGSANEKLLQANEQLQTNDKMQREFINIAAHELRTPTQAIMGYSELFDMRPEGREEAMKAIARNAGRLERLTNYILDVTRIEGNALNLSKENFNIRELVLSAVNDAKNSFSSNGKDKVEINYKSTEDIIVNADRARINQVISNMINNAIKFTRNGEIQVRSERKSKDNTEGERGVEKEQSEVMISVTDTGTGIHKEILSRLFTKFASKSQTGTGLGLFISKSIVEAHGGRIWGENNSNGKGATFGFTLPVTPVEENESSSNNDFNSSNINK
jgi:signal transduction histidine kinase